MSARLRREIEEEIKNDLPTFPEEIIIEELNKRHITITGNSYTDLCLFAYALSLERLQQQHKNWNPLPQPFIYFLSFSLRPSVPQ